MWLIERDKIQYTKRAVFAQWWAETYLLNAGHRYMIGHKGVRLG